MVSSRTELDAYTDLQSNSARLHRRALQVMPGGNTRTTVHRDPFPPYAVRGYGQIIVDAEGESRLDFLNNYTALIHGHADPEVVASVSAQMQDGSSFGMPTPSEVDLAELLVERIASIDQIRFTNSGTEGVMAAIQAARAYTGRTMIAKFDGSYHGSYDFAAVGALAKIGPAGELATVAEVDGTPDAVIDNVVMLPYNDLNAMERVLTAYKDRLAAVLIDLIPWRMGLIAVDPAFLIRLRELTQAFGILLIFDEVITLRVAAGGAQAETGVTPNLTTMGKVIGGGFPIGAVGGRADVMAVFDPRSGKPKVPLGGTFTANPVTMVAGLATMRKMTAGAYARLNADGDYLRRGLTDVMEEAAIPGQVTGKGSLFGLCFRPGAVRDYRTWLGSEPDRRLRGEVYSRLLRSGIVVAPHLVGCLSTPPMERADLDALIEGVRHILRQLRQEGMLPLVS